MIETYRFIEAVITLRKDWLTDSFTAKSRNSFRVAAYIIPWYKKLK